MRSTNGGGRTRAFPRLLLGATAAALALACTACAPEPGARDQRTDTPEADEPRMTSEPGDSLRLSLEAPGRVAPGQPVPFTFRIRNIADRTLSLHLTGREIAFDIVVERPDGSTVWRRLEGEVIRSILRLDTLAPGEALVLEATWDQRSDAGSPVPPGEYRVYGELLTEGDPLRSPAEPLRIAPDPEE